MANEINVQLGEPHTPHIGLERIMYSPTTIIYDPNPATTEEAGIVELATNAETLAGTDDERAITPAGLHSTIGEAGGLAGLDEHGMVPSSQLPAYVDDTREGYLYNNHFYKDSTHTELVDNDQEGGLIYIDLSTNLTYRWGGSTYVEISPSLALGETSTTAYRGDRGKTAYDHATDANRNTTAQTKKLYKMSVTSEGHVGQVEESTAETDIANLQENVEDLDNGLFKGGWRTPISNEWDYVLNTRSASTVSGTNNARYVKAQINSINGLILLPDVFELPSGITLLNINAKNATAADNTYTTSQWETLENAGCVFLPCSGYRDGTSMSNINSYGFYSTSQQAYTATQTVYLFLHSGSSGISITYTAKRMGKSVRLIKENTEGAFSISSTLKADIAKSNLQFHCLNKEWRFAPHAYDIIGADNANIAENYNGYIDLFGYGTSGWNSGATVYQPWSSSTNDNEYITHDLTGDYANADWGIYSIKKRLQDVAFSGDYNDLGNKPQLATSAEAIAGTDDEKVLTPKTNRDAHDAWHWFGTQAEFDALAPDYDPDVIYHVETTDDNAGYEFRDLTYASTLNLNIGTQPVYALCKCTGDLQINISNLGNNRENHIVLYSEVTDTGYHSVILNTAPTGLTLIGELKPLPINNSNPFYGQPNITQCFVQGVDICIIKVGSNMVVTWKFLGYKS